MLCVVSILSSSSFFFVLFSLYIKVSGFENTTLEGEFVSSYLFLSILQLYWALLLCTHLPKKMYWNMSSDKSRAGWDL